MNHSLKPHLRSLALATVSGVLALSPFAFADDHSQKSSNSSTVDHIFWIMMENHGTPQIFGNTADAPYINSIAKRGAALNYYGVTHPSLPNYLAAISGDYQGLHDDCKAGPTVTVMTCDPSAPLSELSFVPGAGDATDPTSPVYTDKTSPLYGQKPPQLTPAEITTAENTVHWFAGQTIVDQLENKGMTWKAYMQSLPEVGSTTEYWPVTDLGHTYKLYAQKHNPFMYFSNIRNNPARMANIVPLPQLDYDLANTTPNFVWISPDQCNDMHGVGNGAPVGYPTCSYPASGLDHGAIQLGDAFLKQTVGKIMASKAWTEQNSIMVIVWDEDDYGGYPNGCCGSPTGTTGTQGNTLGGALAPAIVLRSHDNGSRSSKNAYNHYSTLGTIQKVWGLPCLAQTCALSDSQLMTDLFTSNGNGHDE